MVSAEPNIHGTAIVVKDKGFLLLGPSGSGKSAAALAIISQAADRRHYAALVADDQVFVSSIGGRIVARSAPSIAGLMEIRGAGIVSAISVSRSILHFAVQLIPKGTGERIPPEHQVRAIGDLGALPLLYLPFPINEPWVVLERIAANRAS